MRACCRVLVMEDNVDAGEALCAFLQTCGHETWLAVSGQRGIERVVRERPDVIVVDLGLNDLDGCKVVELIRSTRFGDVPLILAYSGYHQREWEALNAGCDAFVLKPYVEELESLIGFTREAARDAAQRPATAARRQ